MLLLIIFLACIFVAAGTGALAAMSDFRGMVIPNLYSVLVLGAFVAAYGALWAFGRADVFFAPLSHLLSALIVFLITLVMFALRGIGAADSKLGTAYALWVGMPGLPAFLFYMTVFGGLLGLSALILKKWTPVQAPPDGSWVARVQSGESKVPYGIAIVFGALASFVNLGYFSGDVLSSFLVP